MKEEKIKTIIVIISVIFLVLFSLFIVAREIEYNPKICNENNICEIEDGEKFLNCPTDCKGFDIKELFKNK